MRAAVIQMNSGEDKALNLETAGKLLVEAAGRGASVIVLPEMFTYLGRSEHHGAVAEMIPGPTSELIGSLARRHRVNVVAGSYFEAVPDEPRLFNTSLAIADDGSIAGRYRKLHLFDVDVDGNRYRESDTIAPGQDAVVTKLNDVPVGLTICYDLRFPELYRRLAGVGAKVITAPAAFTLETGKDHWELLVRARAVENQVFMLAAAQFGPHPPRNACYGNAMIVDPWGTVVARAPHREAVVVADLDLEYQEAIRRGLPSLMHRRSDLFSDSK